jgi:LPS-assembly lipoprotein
MWWRSSAFAAAALAGALALGLTACGFQPMYGGSTVGGAKLAEVMSAVDVTPIPGRVGQKVRNELIFANTGGGYAAPARYKLDIAIRERVIDQMVQITGDARGQVFELTAQFKIVNLANGQIIHQGNAISRAPYERFQEIFSNVRARYDAENRAARIVAESIKTQVAAYLSNAA